MPPCVPTASSWTRMTTGSRQGESGRALVREHIRWKDASVGKRGLPAPERPFGAGSVPAPFAQSCALGSLDHLQLLRREVNLRPDPIDATAVGHGRVIVWTNAQDAEPLRKGELGVAGRV